ncbi:MAG TPA: hypothetical protein QGH36_03275 [Candidatus Marinimicrobia bacterium]|nr:hypothetical protein [Candidatus Neomarinimicrobiota bacterium]
MKTSILILSCLAMITFPACEKEEGCDDCGGTILDGYYFNEVTDINSELAAVPDIVIVVGDCIRYKKLDDDEFDLETVKVVDDCCCDQ